MTRKIPKIPIEKLPRAYRKYMEERVKSYASTGGGGVIAQWELRLAFEEVYENFKPVSYETDVELRRSVREPV